MPLVDIGMTGEDHGQGGKYLVLPADYDDDVPDGYIPVRTSTCNVFMGVRSILASFSDDNVPQVMTS